MRFFRFGLMIIGCLWLTSGLFAASADLESNVPSKNTDEKELSFFEKGNLNDPIMNFDMDPLATKLEQHIYQIREGSPGGYDASGGSCGCN